MHGVLWDLALLGHCARSIATRAWPRASTSRVVQPVDLAGGPKRALVYFGANTGPGVARPDYIADILAAARSWPLSANAIEVLERVRLAAVASRQ